MISLLPNLYILKHFNFDPIMQLIYLISLSLNVFLMPIIIKKAKAKKI